MDDILFENIYTDTEDLMTELSRKLSARFRWIWGTIYILFSLIFLLAMAVTGTTDYLLPLLLCAGYLIYTFSRHRLAARRYMKHYIKFHDGIMPETIHRFSDDTVYSIFGNQTFHLPITKIDKAAATDRLLILFVGKTHRLTIAKDAFTKGTYEEFLQFLQAKCPDLKIPE